MQDNNNNSPRDGQTPPQFRGISESGTYQQLIGQFGQQTPGVSQKFATPGGVGQIQLKGSYSFNSAFASDIDSINNDLKDLFPTESTIPASQMASRGLVNHASTMSNNPMVNFKVLGGGGQGAIQSNQSTTSNKMSKAGGGQFSQKLQSLDGQMLREGADQNSLSQVNNRQTMDEVLHTGSKGIMSTQDHRVQFSDHGQQHHYFTTDLRQGSLKDRQLQSQLNKVGGVPNSEHAKNSKRPTFSLSNGIMGTRDQDPNPKDDTDRSKQNPFDNENDFEEHDRQAFMSIQQQMMGRNGTNDMAPEEFYSGRFNNLSNTQSNKKRSSNMISRENSSVASPQRNNPFNYQPSAGLTFQQNSNNLNSRMGSAQHSELQTMQQFNLPLQQQQYQQDQSTQPIQVSKETKLASNINKQDYLTKYSEDLHSKNLNDDFLLQQYVQTTLEELQLETQNGYDPFQQHKIFHHGRNPSQMELRDLMELAQEDSAFLENNPIFDFNYVQDESMNSDQRKETNMNRYLEFLEAQRTNQMALKAEASKLKSKGQTPAQFSANRSFQEKQHQKNSSVMSMPDRGLGAGYAYDDPSSSDLDRIKNNQDEKEMMDLLGSSKVTDMQRSRLTSQQRALQFKQAKYGTVNIKGRGLTVENVDSESGEHLTHHHHHLHHHSNLKNQFNNAGGMHSSDDHQFHSNLPQPQMNNYQSPSSHKPVSKAHLLEKKRLQGRATVKLDSKITSGGNTSQLGLPPHYPISTHTPRALQGMLNQTPIRNTKLPTMKGSSESLKALGYDLRQSFNNTQSIASPNAQSILNSHRNRHTHRSQEQHHDQGSGNRGAGAGRLKNDSSLNLVTLKSDNIKYTPGKASSEILDNLQTDDYGRPLGALLRKYAEQKKEEEKVKKEALEDQKRQEEDKKRDKERQEEAERLKKSLASSSKLFAFGRKNKLNTLQIPSHLRQSSASSNQSPTKRLAMLSNRMTSSITMEELKQNMMDIDRQLVSLENKPIERMVKLEQEKIRLVEEQRRQEMARQIKKGAFFQAGGSGVRSAQANYNNNVIKVDVKFSHGDMNASDESPTTRRRNRFKALLNKYTDQPQPEDQARVKQSMVSTESFAGISSDQGSMYGGNKQSTYVKLRELDKLHQRNEDDVVEEQVQENNLLRQKLKMMNEYLSRVVDTHINKQEQTEEYMKKWNIKKVSEEKQHERAKLFADRTLANSKKQESLLKKEYDDQMSLCARVAQTNYIDHLERKLKDLDEQVQHATLQRNQLTAKEKLYQKIDFSKKEIAQERRILQMESEIERNNDKSNQIVKRKEKTNKELKDIEPKLLEANKRKDQLEKRAEQALQETEDMYQRLKLPAIQDKLQGRELFGQIAEKLKKDCKQREEELVVMKKLYSVKNHQIETLGIKMIKVLKLLRMESDKKEDTLKEQRVIVEYLTKAFEFEKQLQLQNLSEEVKDKFQKNLIKLLFAKKAENEKPQQPQNDDTQENGGGGGESEMMHQQVTMLNSNILEASGANEEHQSGDGGSTRNTPFLQFPEGIQNFSNLPLNLNLLNLDFASLNQSLGTLGDPNSLGNTGQAASNNQAGALNSAQYALELMKQDQIYFPEQEAEINNMLERFRNPTFENKALVYAAAGRDGMNKDEIVSLYNMHRFSGQKANNLVDDREAAEEQKLMQQIMFQQQMMALRQQQLQFIQQLQQQRQKQQAHGNNTAHKSKPSEPPPKDQSTLHPQHAHTVSGGVLKGLTLGAVSSSSSKLPQLKSNNNNTTLELSDESSSMVKNKFSMKSFMDVVGVHKKQMQNFTPQTKDGAMLLISTSQTPKIIPKVNFSPASQQPSSSVKTVKKMESTSQVSKNTKSHKIPTVQHQYQSSIGNSNNNQLNLSSSIYSNLQLSQDHNASVIQQQLDGGGYGNSGRSAGRAKNLKFDASAFKNNNRPESSLTTSKMPYMSSLTNARISALSNDENARQGGNAKKTVQIAQSKTIEAERGGGGNTDIKANIHSSQTPKTKQVKSIKIPTINI